MIHLSHITKCYGSAVALDDITVDIEPGIITALVGHNGAGKTTCLRILVGLITPDAGSIDVNSFNPRRHNLKVRQQIGYIPDNPFVSPRLTGYEHLQFHADVYKQPKALYHAQQLAEQYRLTEKLKAPVATYSRGMIQRLALIRVLMIDCPVLLLDEPFNALDPIGIETLRTDLRKRVAQGGTVLISSHLLSMLTDFTQKVIVLKQGKLIHAGPTSDIDWDVHMTDWFEPQTELHDKVEE